MSLSRAVPPCPRTIADLDEATKSLACGSELIKTAQSFTGWHRHVTRTVLAQAFRILPRLDPPADAPA